MKILIVDDDKITRKILSFYLKSKGHQIITAENGLDAIEKIGVEPVDMIVTDLNMPYMDGLELTRTIRADAVMCGIPVIMITTEADDEERKQADEAGVTDYLVKPASADQIAASIQRIQRG